ncbi:MAG TPA: hypothetical protein DCP90_03470 [Clostridiales bacterium]|nr:hypothetical protein [Clostridiales bacterium]
MDNTRVDGRIIVGKLKREMIHMLNINLPADDISMYHGFKKHVKKKHPHCEKYIFKISDIISNPDYIGVHPNEPNSIELVKRLDKNILVAITLSEDIGTKYLYASSLYDISEPKLQNRINSKRLLKWEN